MSDVVTECWWRQLPSSASQAASSKGSARHRGADFVNSRRRAAYTCPVVSPIASDAASTRCLLRNSTTHFSKLTRITVLSFGNVSATYQVPDVRETYVEGVVAIVTETIGDISVEQLS